MQEINNTYDVEKNDVENKKIENETKKVIKEVTIFSKIKWMFFGIIVGILISISFYNEIKMTINKTIKSDNVDIEYITGIIRNMSDLITSELEYTGIVEYKTHEGEFLNFLTGEEFLMVYTAEIKAGIDLSKVSIEKTEDKIIVNMPRAALKYKKVKPDTIRYYDTKIALIKGDGKQLGREAQVEAENDIDKNVNIEKLLNSAEEQAKKVIEGFVKEISGNLIVEFNITDI